MIATDRQLNEITASCLRRILNVTRPRHEAIRKTAGQDVLGTTIKKDGRCVGHEQCMHRRLQKSKTDTALDS